MLMLKAWLFVFLTFNLPAEWTQASAETCESIQEPIGLHVDECFAAWTNGDKELYAFIWRPHPPLSRDRGPMVVAAESPGKLLGKDVTITRTSMFFGQKQEVLTASTTWDVPEATIMIYARNVSLEEFQTLLDGVERSQP